MSASLRNDDGGMVWCVLCNSVVKILSLAFVSVSQCFVFGVNCINFFVSTVSCSTDSGLRFGILAVGGGFRGAGVLGFRA